MSLASLVIALLVAAPEPDDLVIGEPVAPRRLAEVWAGWTTHLGILLDPPPSAVGRLTSSLTLGLDWTAAGGFDVALQTRLRQRLHFTSDDSPGADFGAEVRKALVRWQDDCRELALGMEITRWGRTLSRLLDLANPLDWREGPPESDERVPVFALSLRQALGQGELHLRWTPFYFGSAFDLAPEPAPTQDVWHSSELAARLTQRLGPFDAAATWLWRFDRRAILPEPDLVARPELAPAIPPRQHVLGLELATSGSLLRWSAESVLVLEQRLFHADLSSEPGAVLRWATDVGVAPAIFLDATLGLEGAHALGMTGAPTWHEGPDDLWLHAAMALLLAWDGRLRLDAETRYGLLRDDRWVLAALGLRATDALELSAGFILYGGDALDVGLGALYDQVDHLWLRATLTL